MRAGARTGLAVVVAAATAVILGGTVRPLAQGAAAGVAPDLPKAARSVLDARWKGWTLASIDRVGNEACLDGAPGSSPAFVSGDFSGDGRPDFALEVTAADGVHLAVLIGRLDEYDLFDAANLGSTSKAILHVGHRGTPYRAKGSAISQYFGSDTLVYGACGEPGTALFWMGFGFTPVVLESGD